MENNIEREIQQEIAYYNALPVTFEDFVDMPEQSDGEIYIVCSDKKPGNPEINKLPMYYITIWTCHDRTNVGDINLRIGYNDEMYYTGNTGYHIYEQHRGKGYAVRACKLLIPLLKAHNMTHLLITNALENTASIRVCEKLGAKFIRTAPVPEWHILHTKFGRAFQNIYDWRIE